MDVERLSDRAITQKIGRYKRTSVPVRRALRGMAVMTKRAGKAVSGNLSLPALLRRARPPWRFVRETNK